MHQMRFETISRILIRFGALLSLLAFLVQTPLMAAEADGPAAPSGQNWFDQKYMTGNWGGARDKLASHGLIFDLELTQFYQGLMSGTGSKKAEYGGKADYIMYFLGSQVGLKGFSIALHGETRFGHDINTLAGLTPPNVNMLYPEPGVQSSYLTQWLVSQELTDNGWTVMGGKMNGIDLMDMVLHTGRGVDKFMNTALVLPLGFVRTTNLSIMGTGVMKMHGREVEGALVFYDTNNSSASNGFDHLFADGFVALGLWRFFYDVDGLAGNSTFFGNYSTKKFVNIDPNSFVFVPGVGLFPSSITGSWMVGYAFDQALWVDPVNPEKKVGLSGQFTWTDGNPSPIQWTASVALESTGYGLLERDSAGIGFFYEGLSSDFIDLAKVAGLGLKDAFGVEAYYTLRPAPWLAFTADLQVVNTNVRGNDTAVIGAIRSNIKF